MEITKAMVLLEEDGVSGLCDVIEHEGMPWLVPYWLDMPDVRLAMPARIILLANIPHQHHPQSKNCQWTVNEPLPNALFDWQTPWPAGGRFVVQDRPEIVRDTPRG
jgi:hypothetical protein